MVLENIRSITGRIHDTCRKISKDPSEVELVCVTKGVSLDAIEEALASGVTTFGENRVQEALVKYDSIDGRALWHLVGHLQTNKVKDAVSIFSLIHSIDSARLAKEIDKEASRIDKVQDILIQVNVSGEESKFGVRSEEAVDFFKSILLYPNINIKGLMTIAPETANPEKSRPCFRGLRELLGNINSLGLTPSPLRILSMGMTDDFEVAIEEGSTMVRIGRGIFND
jgi:pyridoxal phosphate enzyme (YggS family)